MKWVNQQRLAALLRRCSPPSFIMFGGVKVMLCVVYTAAHETTFDGTLVVLDPNDPTECRSLFSLDLLPGGRDKE